MKHLISFLFFLGVTAMGAAAQEMISFAQLRSRIDEGAVATDGNLYVEGIITGEPESLNHEKNVNSHYSYTSTAPASRTTYMQDAEGRYGFRLQFTATRHALIPRYSHVLLNLKGLTLSKEEGFGYTISEIAPENLVRIEAGKKEDVPIKSRRVSDLTPEDIYTFVTLEDCEFVFKGGSYMNVYETYLPASETNKGLGANSTLDSWASLLVDKDGNPFYLLMNGRCPWRRKGNGLPQGAGRISGILVHTVLERYGDCLGPYQIRPVAEEDIDFHGASHFQTLAEWDWMDNAAEFRTEGGPKRSVVNERIAADQGRGWIHTDVVGTVVREMVELSGRQREIRYCRIFNGGNLRRRNVPGLLFLGRCDFTGFLLPLPLMVVCGVFYGRIPFRTRPDAGHRTPYFSLVVEYAGIWRNQHDFHPDRARNDGAPGPASGLAFRSEDSDLAHLPVLPEGRHARV